MPQFVECLDEDTRLKSIARAPFLHSEKLSETGPGEPHLRVKLQHFTGERSHFLPTLDLLNCRHLPTKQKAHSSGPRLCVSFAPPDSQALTRARTGFGAGTDAPLQALQLGFGQGVGRWCLQTGAGLGWQLEHLRIGQVRQLSLHGAKLSQNMFTLVYGGGAQFHRCTHIHGIRP